MPPRTTSRVAILCLLPSLFALLLAGCQRQASGPPLPLAVEQIPAEFNKTFAKASGDLKTLADLVVVCVQTNGYVDAFQANQQLCVTPNATKEQAVLAARAHLSLQTALQSAQSQGDQTAQAALQEYRRTK